MMRSIYPVQYKIWFAKGIGLAILVLPIVVSFTSCMARKNSEALKKEIGQTEKDFQELLNRKGAAAAFYEFAAEDAVVKRENDSLIAGKEAIRKYYDRRAYRTAQAIWEPDFIDVSNDGTLAYTYGKYEWTFSDSAGQKKKYAGIFHTVWKRMPDGSWKYVWD
jgi:ketosteroid isomerase-like protein